MNTNYGLITGASSGIGKACAMILAKNGYGLILTGRREDRLEEVKNEIESKFQVPCKVAVFDVRNRTEVEEFVQSLEEPWSQISVLINNAGLAMGLSSI